MKTTDVKSLWGRAANRCSFTDCKLELTPAGAKETLGEMAHIVAKSPDGPRGRHDISPEAKDSYENLILLCPTHHKMVDNDPDEWTAEKVGQLKKDHEKWVTEQLDKGSIAVQSIDNSAFLVLRKEDWYGFSRDYAWIISALTPLNISEDVANPLEQNYLNVLNKLRLPERFRLKRSVDPDHTRPNEHGVGNEELRAMENGSGHRIQIFRNGHCEFSICFGSSTRDIAEIWEGAPSDFANAKVVVYTDIVNCFRKELQGLNQIWHGGLPFNDMLLTTCIINASSTCLYAGRTEWKPLIGPKISSNTLEFANVVNKSMDVDKLFEHIIERFVNNYGLVLDSVFDDNGNIVEPKKLSP